MSQKRIDKAFREALGSYSSSIDEDQLWSEIESRVPRRKRKNRIFIWFALGLLLLIPIFIDFQTAPRQNLNSQVLDSLENDTVNNSNIDDNETIESSTNKVLGDVEINQNSPFIHEDRNYSNPISNQLDKDENNTIGKDIIHNVNSGSEAWHLSTNEGLAVEHGYTRFEKETLDICPSIPALDFVLKSQRLNSIELPEIAQRKSKRIKPLKRPRPFVRLNYYAGKYMADETLSGQDDKYIDFGEAYFSQGLSISYNHFLSSRLYTKVSMAVDQSYKKYADFVNRDTIVPSSSGSQAVTYNQYQGGLIDTEFGIPEVNAVFNRDVVNNNKISSLSIGLGAGYVQPIGRMNINLEAELQRTIYYSLVGLGRDDSSQKIEELESFENYFSLNPKYSLSTNVSTDFELSTSVLLSAGIQYQMGLSSIVNEQSGHEEKINLFRGSIGLKWIL